MSLAYFFEHCLSACFFANLKVVDGALAPVEDLNLPKEKVRELQKIRAQLPSAPQAVRLEEDVARIPDTGPFRLMLVNVTYKAQRKDIEE